MLLKSLRGWLELEGLRIHRHSRGLKRCRTPSRAGLDELVWRCAGPSKSGLRLAWSWMLELLVWAPIRVRNPG